MELHPHHKPTKPLDLQILQYLHPRKEMTDNEKLNYINLQKGYEGELKFYQLLKKQLPSNYHVLYSFLFELNNTVFQIDCLIIFQNTIYLLEIKNYEGDFYIKNDSWYIAPSNKKIRNPIHQLERTQILFRELLQSLGYHFLIKPYIILINEQFTLYQAPQNLPVIFPTQLNRFVNQLNSIPVKLTSTHTKLVNQLVSRHIDESVYIAVLEYGYEELKKGITCPSCPSFLSFFNARKMICKKCSYVEGIESAIMRSVAEFRILFPNKKITINAIKDWCKVIDSKKQIRRILSTNLILAGIGKASHYEFENKEINFKV